MNKEFQFTKVKGQKPVSLHQLNNDDAIIEDQNEEEQKFEPEELHINVNCIDLKGRSYAGTFIARLITPEDIKEIAKIKVRLAGGLPLDSFQPEELALLNALATCARMFKKEAADSGRVDPAPSWWYSDDISTETLPLDLIFGLSDKVRVHTDRYFRRNLQTGKIESGRGLVTFS